MRGALGPLCSARPSRAAILPENIGQIVRSEHMPRASPFRAIWANQDHPRCSQYLRLTNYTVKASLQCEIDFRDLPRSR